MSIDRPHSIRVPLSDKEKKIVDVLEKATGLNPVALIRNMLRTRLDKEESILHKYATSKFVSSSIKKEAKILLDIIKKEIR